MNWFFPKQQQQSNKKKVDEENETKKEKSVSIYYWIENRAIWNLIFFRTSELDGIVKMNAHEYKHEH